MISDDIVYQLGNFLRHFDEGEVTFVTCLKVGTSERRISDKLATSWSAHMVITPLDGTNYPTWKLQCQIFLMKEGLWSITSETARRSDADAGTEAQMKFDKRRDKALAIIVLPVNTSLLYLPSEPVDAKAVWKHLVEQFPKRTRANKLQQ